MDNDLNELIGRIRINESKISALRERLLVTDSNMISEYKKLSYDIRSLEHEIREIKKEVFEIKESIKDMIKEMQNFAKSSDLKVLEKYINLWNPLNFVTDKEVKKLINEELQKITEKKVKK